MFKTKLILKEAPVLYEDTHVYRNDCTIHSLSTALNITYELALAILQHVKPGLTGDYVITNKPIPKSQFSRDYNFRNLIKLFANEKQHEGFRPTYVLANDLKGTHIALEKGHAKVIHEGHVIDTFNTLAKDVRYTYRIYRSKYIPFLEEVCEALDMDLKQHTQKHSLNHYIKHYDYNEYIENKKKRENELQDYDEFVEVAKLKNIDTSIYNQPVKINGREYRVVRLEKRNRKYPIILKDGESAQGYKVSPSQLEMIMSGLL